MLRIKTNIKQFVCILLLIHLLFCSAMADNSCQSATEQLKNVDEWTKVAKIIDGDTLHLQNGRKVRLIGINTPEIGRRGEASEPFAYQAHKLLIKLLQGNKKIGLSYDKDKRDRYKRLLAYVILADGRSAEQVLLGKGMAYSIVIPPNARNINCYRAIEREARMLQRGLWQLPEYQQIKAHDLSAKSKGYRFISGTVSAYRKNKKSIYLKLTPHLSIRIAKKDLQYFSNVNLKELVGEKLLIRGRVSSFKGRQSIHIRTAYDLEQAPNLRTD